MDTIIMVRRFLQSRTMAIYKKQPIRCGCWETSKRMCSSLSKTTTTTTITLEEDTITMAKDTATTFNPHFVVVSLGNPPPIGESLHSAGHVAVQALQRKLRQDLNQPEFASERFGKKAVQASTSSKYTLLQSPTYMNVSGPWVGRAWAEVHSDVTSREPDRPVALVVVHDELEEDMCVVKIRKWERSHRGHNGLKSTQASIQPRNYPRSKLAKISIGIGRPEGRDPNTVSQYVLKPWSKHQKQTLLDNTGGSVLAALHEIEATWKAEREKGVSTEPAPAKAVRKTRK